MIDHYKSIKVSGMIFIVFYDYRRVKFSIFYFGVYKYVKTYKGEVSCSKLKSQNKNLS